MKIDEIGYATLSDIRARSASEKSPMVRCDMVLTDRCTFRCPYCQGIREDCQGSVSMEEAKRMIDLWTENGLMELRLTGGEPTVWPGIVELVKYAKSRGTRSVGLSTNAFSDLALYNELIDAGVDVFSISLDTCNPEVGDRMSGGIKGSWYKVTANIREISKRAYVWLGIVTTAETAKDLPETIDFALSLGVHDIKLVSASQYNQLLTSAGLISKKPREEHPLLNYRITNMEHGRNIRGLTEYDSHRCPLVLDDSSFAGGYHFPCTVYMRERGEPIGIPNENMRLDRAEWYRRHDSHKDPICSAYCIDFFVEYNNRYLYFHLKDQKKVPVLDPKLFSVENYDRNGKARIGAENMTFDNVSAYADNLLHHPDYELLGICLTDDMSDKPVVPKCSALLYKAKNGEHFWFTVKSSELGEILL